MLKHILKIIYSSAFVLLTACATGGDKPTAWPLEQRVKAHIALGENYLQQGKLEIARERFEKALRLKQNSSEAYHGLGLVEAKLLNLSLAKSYLKKAVRLNSDNMGAVSDYAVILCDSGSAKQGINLLQNNPAVSRKPSLGAKLALGRCFEANHQPEKALIAYERVLSSHPNTHQALLSMAHLKFNNNNFLSARAFIQRYFSTNTISSDALLLGAKIERQLNNDAQRIQYTRQLWQRYPKSKQATEARELFSR